MLAPAGCAAKLINMGKTAIMYPDYAREERIADGVIHALGVTAALAGAISLIIWAAVSLGGGGVAAISIYAAALMATFIASACYHMSPRKAWQPMLRRIDHAAIYLKIAGTFTPLVVLVGSALGYGILALVWALAAFGMVRKLFYWQTPGRWGPVLPLVMGWMGLILVWAAWPMLPGGSVALIIAGGLTYSIGVIFFIWEDLKYAMAIWHAHVFAASGFFFVAIALTATAAVPG